jgi:hypothetical protein
MTTRPIVTKYDARCLPFPWQATFGEYDIGDPIGIGETEEAAISDLMAEQELDA